MNNKIDLTEIRNLSEYAQKSRSTGIMVPAHELEYLLSEYDRLQEENERLRKTLNKICFKATEVKISNIAFNALHEDGDKE
jgi:regulator of replication initiation timing